MLLIKANEAVGQIQVTVVQPFHGRFCGPVLVESLERIEEKK